MSSNVRFNAILEQDASDLIDDLSNNGVKVAIFNVDEVADMIDLLLRAYRGIASAETYINFIVICRNNCMLKVLNKVRVEELFIVGYS